VEINNGDLKNNTKNQWYKKLVLWKDKQDRTQP
jgi:hypothetical protein